MSESAESCVFCGIVAGTIPAQEIYRDDLTMAFLTIQPINPGHTLVIPLKHEPDLFALDSRTYQQVMRVAHKLAAPVQEAMEPKRMGMGVAGWDVPHAHVHLVPMHEYHDITSRKMIEGSLETASAEELAQVADGLRKILARPAPPEIELVTGSPFEEQARERLLRLHEEYDLQRWHFRDLVRIQTGVIPNAFGVITLNPYTLRDDHNGLTTYIHEQLHFFCLQHEAATNAAIAELNQRYAEVPDQAMGGANTRYSTIAHLIVCTLEIQGLEDLIGVEAAAKTIAGLQFYRWIYDTINADRAYFTDLLQRHGLVVP